MLFTLVKNELIKICKRSKTWVVFILFITLVGLTIYGSFYQEKQSKRNLSYNIENLNQQIKNNNEQIKSLENATDTKSKETLDGLKKSQETLKTEKQNRENEISGKVDIEQLKASREDEIKMLEANLKDNNNDARSKVSIQQQLETVKYLRDNNIYQTENYKTNPYVFMKMLFVILGTILLVAGIAVFMSDIVSGECTPPTLKFLLIQPISRGKVLLSKFIAVTITVVSMLISTELLGFLFMGITRGFNMSNYPVLIGQKYKMQYDAATGGSQIVAIDGSAVMATNAELLLKALLLQVLFIITCCAFIFLISTLFKSSMITMAISVLLTVAVTIFFSSISFLTKKAHLLFISYANTQGVITGNVVNMYDNVNMTLTNAIIVMVVTTVVSYAIAHFIFNKKDILI